MTGQSVHSLPLLQSLKDLGLCKCSLNRTNSRLLGANRHSQDSVGAKHNRNRDNTLLVSIKTSCCRLELRYQGVMTGMAET